MKHCRNGIFKHLISSFPAHNSHKARCQRGTELNPSTVLPHRFSSRYCSFLTFSAHPQKNNFINSHSRDLFQLYRSLLIANIPNDLADPGMLIHNLKKDESCSVRTQKERQHVHYSNSKDSHIYSVLRNNKRKTMSSPVT